MDEFALIKRFFDRHQNGHGVILGVGDDCAIVTPPSDTQLVMSVDTQVAGRHFPSLAEANFIAARALHSAVSDLAAMGADPLWFTVALTLPNADSNWLELFSEGLFEAAEQYGITLVGGDTTKGNLTVSIHVQGSVPIQRGLLRSGAKAGDQIFVSGTLGDGKAGLAVISGELQIDSHNASYLKRRFFQPLARVNLGKTLRDLASSCIDISDGLLADLQHICEDSRVGAELDSSKIPMSAELLASVPTGQALEWALTGGDDYQLCFTANEEHSEKLMTMASERLIDVTRIGEIVAGSGIADLRTHKPYRYKQTGFKHF